MGFLTALPARLTDDQLLAVEAIAAAPLPAAQPCSPERFAAFLRSLAILPRRGDDDVTGEHRAKLYAKTLGHLPADAIGFLTRRALETCRWFPTIAECLEIVAHWRRADADTDVRASAWRRAETERAARLDELADRLRAAIRGEAEVGQAEINALPERIKHRLDAMMLLWRLPSGRYAIRTGTWAEALASDQQDEAA